jgi:signal transduction histidine kinase
MTRMRAEGYRGATAGPLRPVDARSAVDRAASRLRRAVDRWADAVGERAGRLPALAADLAPAVVLLAAMTAVHLGPARETGTLLPLALALCVLIAGSLAFRRHAPLAAFTAGTAGLAAEALWVAPGQLTPIANLIAVHSLGLYARPARARLGALLVPPATLAFFAPKGGPSSTPVAVVFVWLLVWAAGYATARRREETERRRALLHRETVIGERVRIARELHDVLGHSVNAMLVQAGAGRMVLDTDPERTRELLTSVERTGRDALGELDRLLGVLRAEDEDRAGLGDLDQLVRTMADAGMTVRLHVGPDARSLPRDVQLSVHRIVQEGLTNALRHGRARTADVTVRGLPAGRAVLVRVVDDGTGPGPRYRPGRGLLGITERAALFGGTVDHGGADGGGFALSVELPLP